MTNTPGPEAGPKTFLLIREDRAPKLGLRSTGGILFQVLTDEQRDKLFIRIAGNEGGGYVSDEAVPVDAIRRCVEAFGQELLQATALKPAFIGRSSNNWGFLRTILVHEQLLRRDPDRPHLAADTGSWDEWTSRHLSMTGELKPIKVGKEPVVKKKPAAPAAKVDDAPAAADGDAANTIATDTPTDGIDADVAPIVEGEPTAEPTENADPGVDASSEPQAESKPGKPAVGRAKGRGKARASAVGA